MENPDQVQFYTRNFDALQGLKLVPFGVFFLAMGADWLGEQGDLSLSLPAFALTLLAYWLISRYYARHFGRVIPEGSAKIQNFLLPLGVALILWSAAAVDYWIRLPVSVFGLVLALALLGLWGLQGRRVRIHYAIMAGLIALISLAPLIGVGEGWSIIQPPGSLYNLIIGAILVIGGILDHMVLVNGLRKRRDE